MRVKSSGLILLLLFLSINSTEAFGQESIPEAQFISRGTLFATMYFDTYYMLQGDALYPGTSEYAMHQKGNAGFTFRRIYLGYDHDFSEKFSGRVVLELKDALPLNNGVVSLKAASLTWRDIYPLADLIIGITSTPTFSVAGSESFWQYRSVEKTLADMRGIRSSSNTGIRIKGLFNKAETLGYNIMAANATGSGEENLEHKIFYLNLWSSLLQRRLYLEIYQDYNKLQAAGSVATTKGFAAWNRPGYTIGAELAHQLLSQSGYSGQNISVLGFSAFAHADIIGDQLRAFARYDSYDPDRGFSISHYDPQESMPFQEHFFLVGLDISLMKNIDLMPNIWINSYKNKTEGQTTPATEVAARITVNILLQ
ncbi:MAG: hypothetical protein R6U64_09695 [Bacteroidales bacterium]